MGESNGPGPRSLVIRGAAAVLLAALVLACPSGPPARAAAQPEQVLLLHSYHQGFAWTDNLTRGVERVLAESGRPIELTVEYMDTKRRNDEGHYANLSALYRGKFPPGLFKILIVTDDDALVFALRLREELFAGVPIVFCGFSHDPTQLIDGQRDVTGIVETQDVRETIELALRLHPATRRVLVINDRTTTGLARQEQIDEVARSLSGRVAVETIANVTIEQLENRLGELGKDALVFLQMFNRDSNGRVFNPRELMKVISASCRQPVYTIKEEYLGLGVVGGYLTAGAVHGEAAARIALRILAGDDPARIPVVQSSINPPSFDDTLLRRFGIEPGRLPPGSLLVNQEAPFYDQYRDLVLGTAAAFVVLLVLVVIQTVSVRDRERAEEDLSITLLSIAEAVIATSGNGHVIRLNPVAERLTGWTAAEARGRGLDEVFRLVDGRTRDALAVPLEEVVGRGATVGHPEDALLVARDGAERRISGAASPIRDRRGATRGMVVVFRDATEQRQMEERLRQAEKMETVGRLAGGIAHDFNNLLGGITGYADLLIVGLAGNDRLRHYAERIVETAERAAGLTRNLLAFSRKGRLQVVDIDLHQAVRDVVGILEQTVDRRITIQARLASGDPIVVGDLSQIQSALLNLGINARDAMPEGGTLTITTEDVVLDMAAAQSLPEGVEPGRYVLVTVADTGAGMTPETVAHLFEPFFSTKPAGKGTGLGLAVVYGTVRAHLGGIVVESRPGAGSTFRVYLPKKEEGAAPPRLEQQGPGPGGGCILLVDDEKIIRNMARDMLRELGYEVLTAGDGEEALEVFARERPRISLVILDIVMPKRNGPEAFRALRALDPQVRVLMSSGYDFDTAANGLLGEGIAGFLQKPFRIAELSAKVAEALAGARPAGPGPQSVP
jgi:PAS domain S-box-containing protein